MDISEQLTDHRIADAKRKLSSRLAELERRVDDAKIKYDPRTWIENPWARLGLAAAVGFVIGRSRFLRPLARAAASAAVTSLLREVLLRPPAQS